jgi:cardiolipin synthase
VNAQVAARAPGWTGGSSRRTIGLRRLAAAAARLGLVAGLWAGLGATGCSTSHPKRLAYHYEPAYGVADAPFERVLRAQSALVGDNDARLLNNGDEFFPAILDAIRSARHSVNVELYIFTAGRVGREFAQALAAKAREGVAVRVLVDALGKRTGGLDRELRAAGVRFAVYKPVRLWQLPKTGDRTHRKIITVDGRIGFTGGFGVDDRWAGDARHPGEWRDVVVRVEGPVVQQLQRLFFQNWLYATGEIPDGEGEFAEVPPAGNIRAQAVGSTRGADVSLAKLHYYLPIQAARERIWIENAYFLPDRDFRRGLVAAARRGVDVRLILPGRHTDIRLTRYAARSDYDELLRGGVRIFEYQPTMLHTKLMVVDGVWTSIGSINFTARSMRANAEANLAIYDRDFARQAEQVIEQDLARSREITAAEWRARGLCDRLRESYASLYKSLF